MDANYDIKRLQGVLLDIAKATKGILEKHKIPYMLALGTLLGAQRHNGFIPWDDDFDFFLFDDSYDEAIKVLREELPPDMFLEDEKSEPLYFHSWAHIKDIHSEFTCEFFPHDSLYSHKGISVDLYRIKRMAEQNYMEYRLTEALDYLQRRLKLGLLDEAEFKERERRYREQFEVKESLENPSKEILGFMTAYVGKGKMQLEDVFPLKQHIFEDTEFLVPNNSHKVLSEIYGDYMKLPPVEEREPHGSSVRFL